MSISKKKNDRHHERTVTYLFTNKLKCYKCGSSLGGVASKKKSGKIERKKDYDFGIGM